jgi:hypothetical protein
MKPTTRRDATARGRALLACGLALVLALAGCDGGGEPASGDQKPPGRTSWPQPVDGKLTTDMCDLLGPDDYAAAGALANAFDERTLERGTQSRGLSCHSAGENWLTLNLQPDSVSGGLYYDWLLRGIHKNAGSPAQQRENVLPGADESWFSAMDGGHQLVVRRGGLIVGLRFGFLNKDIDHLAAATKLVGLVLERTPAGTTATGEPHRVTLTVTGRPAQPGPVDIQYLDPNTVQLVSEKGVTLPWTKKFDVAWYGPTSPGITLNANLSTPALNKYLTCAITVDGKKLDESEPRMSLTTCRGEIPEPQ